MTAWQGQAADHVGDTVCQTGITGDLRSRHDPVDGVRGRAALPLVVAALCAVGSAAACSKAPEPQAARVTAVAVSAGTATLTYELPLPGCNAYHDAVLTRKDQDRLVTVRVIRTVPEDQDCLASSKDETVAVPLPDTAAVRNFVDTSSNTPIPRS